MQATSTQFVSQMVSSTGELITGLVPFLYIMLGLGFAIFGFWLIVKTFARVKRSML